MRLVLATQNQHKVSEIREILNPLGFEIVSFMEFPGMTPVVEDGVTFLDNALKKARAAFEHAGLPCLADDSGLEVDALDGAPGVYSNRFAGEDADAQTNNEKLLHALKGIPEPERTARFRCVVALVSEQGEMWADGVSEGIIAESYHGGGGFGYDPLFRVPDQGRTFAEMTSVEKHAISHRGKAFRRMARMMEDKFC